MGRHADSDGSFRRSLLRAAAGGVAAMLVTFGVTAALTQVGRGDPARGPVVELTAPAATPSPTPTPTPSPTPAQTQVPDPPATEAETALPAPTESPDPPGSVTVQVLAAGATEAQADQAAEALRNLGYEVVAVNLARRTVRTTTVMATAGSQAEAAALAERDDRFGRIRRNRDFNETVDLHILIGPDFGA